MDDLINRQAAIEAVRGRFSMPVDNLIVEVIGNLPSAERRGRWEDVENAPNGLLYVTCSVCGKRQTVEAGNYCGNCGARMEVTE